jgi:hypothetical protein
VLAPVCVHRVFWVVGVGGMDTAVGDGLEG